MTNRYNNSDSLCADFRFDVIARRPSCHRHGYRGGVETGENRTRPNVRQPPKLLSLDD